MLFALVSLVLTTAKNQLGLNHYDSPSAKEFNSLKIGAIFFSLYGFIMPWILERFFLPRFRTSKRRSRMSPETLILLMSYTALYLPVISGEILYPLGLSITHYYYFLSVGILGALIWCIYTLRMNATW
jgi:hypothetical protein